MLNTIATTTILHHLARATIVALCITVVGALQASAAAAQSDEKTGQSDEPAYVEPLTERIAVIPPGREDLLAEMLGRGATLPGQCTFTSGQVERDTVTGTYACPTGPVVLTLRHPTKAPSDATLTERFAIAVQSGSPPAGLVDDLAARIRSRESAFEWTWLGPEGGQASRLTLIIAALLAGGLLFFALRRRLRRAEVA